MSRVHQVIGVSALSLAALLAACGGGSEPAPGALMSTGQAQLASAAAPRALATAAAVVVVDAKALFDWAEYKFPELFPKGPQNFPLLFDGLSYTVRAYPNGNYLGLTAAGVIYGLGPVFTKGQLQSFGNIVDYVALVQGDNCKVYPGSCVDPQPQPTGPANECADAHAATLPTGLRWRLVYELSGSTGSGEQTIESVIDGPSSFLGQSAVKLTTTTSGTSMFQGMSINLTTTIETYMQSAGNGLLRTLGGNVTFDSGLPDIPGLPALGKTITSYVLNPAVVDVEFALLPGQSVSVTRNATTTTIQPVGVPVSTISGVQTYTFEAKESISVLGKTYNTCRYAQTTAGSTALTTAWYIVGKAIQAKTVTVNTTATGQTTDLLQLRSGTYNGAPL